MKRVAYFVHDLQDAAVARRVEMLRHAGHQVALAGFYRRDNPPAQVSGAAAHSLGRTSDGRMIARMLMVLLNMVFAGVATRMSADADVLIARNLETLVLAVRVRRRGQRLVYECLDIHRLMLGPGLVGRIMRWIERWAMRRVDLLLSSSPSFLESYFNAFGQYQGRTLLLENKVPAYAQDGASFPPMAAPTGGGALSATRGEPWVIGWFGMLRCRKTLAMLARLAAESHGCIRIVIAGKPSPAEFPDFATQVADMPGVSYEGPYTPDQLPHLFGQVHFIWAIDYFEESQNSTWLLPNRLYEGIAHGAVPVALESVATGQWLAQHGVGLRLREPVAELSALLSDMNFAEYRHLREQVAAVPAGDVLLLPDEHAACVAQILGTDPARTVIAAAVPRSMEPSDDEAKGLIVIPCLNEEAHLPGLLAQLLADNPGARIVVADGGSHDGSRAIVTDLATRHLDLHLMHNAARLQSAGVNLAARTFGGGLAWMVRIDAHCDYPRDYVAGLIQSARTRQATSVVVPMITRGRHCFQSAVAAAQNSLLGNGGSAHRTMGQGRFVNHGHHALFDLAMFRAVGGYDEGFSHNEDAELDYRMSQMGGRIWLEPAQAIVYYPRRTPGALLRQYIGYGRGRAQTVMRHRMPMALRQALPLTIAPVVALGLLGLGLTGLTPWAWLLVAPMLCWAALCSLYGAVLALRQRRACVLCAGAAAMIMHLGWSLGFLSALRAMMSRKEAWGAVMKPGVEPHEQVPRRVL